MRIVALLLRWAILLSVGGFETHEHRRKILTLLLENGLTLTKEMLLQKAKSCEIAGDADFGELLRRAADDTDV